MNILGLALLASLTNLATNMAAPFLGAATAAAADACVSAERSAVGPAIIRLHLVDQAGLAPAARRELMDESARIWQASGIRVRWSDDRKGEAAEAIAAVSSESAWPELIEVADIPEFPALRGIPGIPGSVDIYLTIARDLPTTHGASQRRPLAEILFIDGVPMTRVTAYPRAAERLLEAVNWDDRPSTERPPTMQQRLVGRMLGRAVAHELGHYVLKSRDHTETGLMRAMLRTDELIAPFDGRLRMVVPRIAVCTTAAREGGR
jgi:hypothetical protein